MNTEIENLLSLVNNETGLAEYLESHGHADYAYTPFNPPRVTYEINPGPREHSHSEIEPPRAALTSDIAVLSFRLRDEAVREHPKEWGRAKELVVMRCSRSFKRMNELLDGLEGADAVIIAGRNQWFVNQGTPSDWIVAALIAQELKKENTDAADR